MGSALAIYLIFALLHGAGIYKRLLHSLLFLCGTSIHIVVHNRWNRVLLGLERSLINDIHNIQEFEYNTIKFNYCSRINGAACKASDHAYILILYYLPA